MMINTSHPQSKPSKKLIDFLQVKIGLSQNALDLGLRQSQIEQAPLPVVLWSFGLLSLQQFQQVLDWERDNQ